MASLLRSPTRPPSTRPPAAGATGPSDRFDAFYEAAWQPLLVQTFAYVGDLTIAREAVRHAFVDAWQHWDRAERKGPEHYVRSAAFARGLLRTRVRGIRGTRRGSVEDRLTIKALHQLPPQLRKAIVLAVLSQVDLHEIGRSLGETQPRTLEMVDTAMAQLSQALGRSPDEVAARMHALARPARASARPTPGDLRARGVRRGRLWLIGGVAAVVALSVGLGALVQAAPRTTAPLPPSLGPSVTRGLLLPTSGLQPLGPVSGWSVLSTSDNTEGDGINSFCQASRFADPKGLRAFVRTYQLTGATPRRATQTIELSRTTQRAHAAYAKVLSWFGGCQTTRLQLLTSSDVSGLGDEAEVIKLRAQTDPGSPAQLSSYAVGVVRTGHIVTWTAFVTRGAENPPTSALVETLSNSLARACLSRAAGSCADRPTVRENPPPPSGEQVGMLAVTDLPAVPTITQKWVGTSATDLTTNPAATSCDRTDMTQAGARPALTRTFLTPGADVPAEFGLSETVGRFGTVLQARGLYAQVESRMDKCTDKDPGAVLSQTGRSGAKDKGSAWRFWRLEAQLPNKKSIVYWTGIARVGSSVAQLSFVAGDGKQDLSRATWSALVQRARDRLYELPVRDGSRPSAGPSGPSGPTSPSRPSASASAGAR